MKLRPERVFIYVFWLGLYYLSYRYPLQINSASTSPTYTFTPMWLQALKYVLYAGLLGMCIMLLSARHARAGRPVALPKNRAWLMPALIYLIVYPFIVAAFMPEYYIYLFQVGFFLTLPLTALLFDLDGNEIAVSVARSLDVFIVLAILAELAQVVLLFTHGRLPALAWGISIFVRFGSIWDDPNGFAMMVPLLAGFAYYRYEGLYRWSVLVLLALMLAVTLSLTGYISIAMAVLLGAIMVVLRSITWVRRRDRNMALAVCGALVLAAGALIALQDFVSLVLEVKSGSIASHMRDYSRIFAAYSPGSVVGAEMIRPGEPGWINIFADLGIVYFLCLATVISVFMVRWFMLWTGSESSDRTMRPLAAGFFLFIAASAVGMGNLPLENVFPVNLIIAVGIALLIILERGGAPETAVGDARV